MKKQLLIDTTHPEEVRVAVVDGNQLVEYETETSTKKQFKGNIYLAKVIRIEPSLQAAFVEYGGNRHGFLPFNEIHPDYYRIPMADREPDEADLSLSMPGEPSDLSDSIIDSTGDEPGIVLHRDEQDDFEDEVPLKTKPQRYKIQEVIKRRQILLIQVVKEERGNKGAALTTYLSLAGRYCVLMPNAGKRSSGGVSRKIIDGEDRKRLRSIVDGLDVANSMSLIVRTAGQEKNRLEIKKDYEYLLKVWEEIRQKTMESVAPSLVHEEGGLLKRSIRDIYNKDISDVLVEGEVGYKNTRNFMKMIIPSHVRKVKLYKESKHLFRQFKVDEQIDNMMEPTVPLPSGGSIVINPTEALIAIDVNSGRSIRERNIDETAYKTNLEAAQAAATQIRLRDLAGIVVIDFIDMNETKHILAVEKALKEAVKADRAKTQVGKISEFGLLQLSRQRLRPSIIEANTVSCHHCKGTGLIRSTESSALAILRGIEEIGLQNKAAAISVRVPAHVDLYLLNQKRRSIVEYEERYNMSISVIRDDSLVLPAFHIDTLGERSKNMDEDLPLQVKQQVATLVDETVTAQTGNVSNRHAQKKKHPKKSAHDDIRVDRSHKKPHAKETHEPSTPLEEAPLETVIHHKNNASPKKVHAQAIDAEPENNQDKPATSNRKKRRENYLQNRRKQYLQRRKTRQQDPSTDATELSKDTITSIESVVSEQPANSDEKAIKEPGKKKEKKGWLRRLIES